MFTTLKIYITSICILGIASLGVAQNSTTPQTPNTTTAKNTKIKDSIAYGWRTKKELGLYVNQVSFTNWNAGGANSISAIFNGDFNVNYKAETFFWNSDALLRYGLNKQQGSEVRKTEDVLALTSNFGFQHNEDSNWFYSAKFSFNTQFAKGFNNDDESYISRFMAPAYLFLGAGFEYGRHIEKLSFYASPFTLKTTFVLSDRLSNQGAFGVTPATFNANGDLLTSGKKSRTELGMLITNQYTDTVMENVSVTSLLRLYSDYLNHFGNIDVEWEITFNLKVNKYISAILGSHIRYDNDIKLETETHPVTNITTVVRGARLQWKQLLGVGLVLNLDDVINTSS